MKKQKKKSGHSFKSTAYRRSTPSQSIEKEPEALANYVRRAEKKVLLLIKEMQAGPAAAEFLLAQQTQVLITGNPLLTIESGMTIANTVLDLWQKGYYIPSPEYPYTLTETLQDLQEGVKAKQDYTEYFQPFRPVKEEPLRLRLQVAAGIVKHPGTRLWQIWIIIDGPYAFFGAYADPIAAQRGLEELINLTRRGGTQDQAEALYDKLASQGDGEPKQLPFDMIEYLVEHLHLYKVEL